MFAELFQERPNLVIAAPVVVGGAIRCHLTFNLSSTTIAATYRPILTCFCTCAI